jgi:hypothetical protein
VSRYSTFENLKITACNGNHETFFCYNMKSRPKCVFEDWASSMMMTPRFWDISGQYNSVSSSHHL